MLLKFSFYRIVQLTPIFLLCSCPDRFGKYGAGHWYTVKAKKNHSLDLKRLATSVFYCLNRGMKEIAHKNGSTVAPMSKKVYDCSAARSQKNSLRD